MNTSDILDLIKADENMMNVLYSVETLQLPDWAIGAGFVRNKVWDTFHGYTQSTPPSDIDVVFFDALNVFDEKQVQDQLRSIRPELNWEVVNQATAHSMNQEKPYTSTEDALSKWPETATAVGVTLKKDNLRLIAPHGIEDLVNMVVRPTPVFFTSADKRAKVRDRVRSKRWKEKWPKLELRID